METSYWYWSASSLLVLQYSIWPILMIQDYSKLEYLLAA